ncbi:hypothetical protein [Paenibacillus whitsoniae]|uniref:Uncharacterized protein n=1 Tax=Paenibacillus whitsoniae TaxID=2496558 RepID=A0A430JL80_9BACL|nr:hypothetical protein [Paenibacillus whitsoniae]RTE11778.1 hypothetical protein EJQ19_00260 [Paenibacillus whitsoniae]
MIQMPGVLSYVTLPDATERTFTNKDAQKFAKIRLLQRALDVEAKIASRGLSDTDIMDIENAIQALDVAPFIESEEKEQLIPEFLTVRDVSLITGLAPQVVRRHLQNGKYEGFQNAGENTTWHVYPTQFLTHPNWQKFLKEREKGFEHSKQVANLALELLELEPPADANDAAK